MISTAFMLCMWQAPTLIFKPHKTGCSHVSGVSCALWYGIPFGTFRTQYLLKTFLR